MRLKDKRIFIVEDNIGNRAITQMLLERHGARVSTDRFGRDAIKRLKQFAPVDLVILDLMLPEGITGYDIFGEIRELAEFDNVPIVAVSAADASEALPDAQDRGFAGFISKPIDFNLFPQQIAQIINGDEVWYTDEQI